MRILKAVLFLAGVTQVVWAAGPSVAVYPLEVLRPADLSMQARSTLQATYKAVLRRTGVSLPDSAKQEAALKALKRSDCDKDDACLAQLARLSGTLYALFTQVDLTADGNVVAFGRVVRDDGKRVAEVDRRKRLQLRRGADSFESLVSVVLTRLFEALHLGMLPAVKEVQLEVAHGVAVVEAGEGKQPPLAQEKDVQEAPAPAASLPLSRAGPSPIRIVSLTAVGTGAAAAIAGAIVFATAGTVSQDAAGNITADTLEKRPGIRMQRGVGIGLLVGGAALAVVGIGMVLVYPEKHVEKQREKEVRMSIVPMSHGALVTLGGHF